MNRLQRLILMQDSAPAHATKGTIKDLSERGINCIKWPSFPPDLNPIEMVWNRMKDWIQNHFDDTLLSYDELRMAVQGA
jgi:transposase